MIWWIKRFHWYKLNYIYTFKLWLQGVKTHLVIIYYHKLYKKSFPRKLSATINCSFGELFFSSLPAILLWKCDFFQITCLLHWTPESTHNVLFFLAISWQFWTLLVCQLSFCLGLVTCYAKTSASVGPALPSFLDSPASTYPRTRRWTGRILLALKRNIFVSKLSIKDVIWVLIYYLYL